MPAPECGVGKEKIMFWKYFWRILFFFLVVSALTVFSALWRQVQGGALVPPLVVGPVGGPTVVGPPPPTYTPQSFERNEAGQVVVTAGPTLTPGVASGSISDAEIFCTNNPTGLWNDPVQGQVRCAVVVNYAPPLPTISGPEVVVTVYTHLSNQELVDEAARICRETGAKTVTIQGEVKVCQNIAVPPIAFATPTPAP